MARFIIWLQSYPPIGALINMETNSKMFQIESLEIQSSRGAFVLQKVILDYSIMFLRAPAERKRPMGFGGWHLQSTFTHKKSVNP
jgi:hypothetical protein